jgi:hypothetical protein
VIDARGGEALARLVDIDLADHAALLSSAMMKWRSALVSESGVICANRAGLEPAMGALGVGALSL